MPLRSFEYIEPASVSEACQILGDYPEEARICAGGTSLLLLMKQSIVRPRYLVNIKKIPRLCYIENDGAMVRIGALTTHHDLEVSPLIAQCFPPIAETEHEIANVRVRSVGTVGGNLGFAEPLTDLPPMFMALDASVKIENAKQSRLIPLGTLFVGHYETILEPGELITEVQISRTPKSFGLKYLRFSAGSDKPAVGCAVSVTLDDSTGVCSNARVVLGCVAPTPLRVEASEALLVGREFRPQLAEQAARVASEACSPLEDIRGSEQYKRDIVKILTARAVTGAFEHAKRLS